MVFRSRSGIGERVKRKKEKRKGYGKLLDAWVPPGNAGDPIGCITTSYTFNAVFFEEECLGRFLELETDPDEDGQLYLVEREEKLANLSYAAALVDQHHCRGSRNLRWELILARPPHGKLHAKISLLYWAQRIRLIIASANMTTDGYRRNQEIFGKLDFRPDGDCPWNCLGDSPIVLIAEIANRGDGAIVIIMPFGDDYYAESAGVELQGPRGRLKYTGPTLDYELAGVFHRLELGESITDHLKLTTDSFAGCDVPGKYSLRFTYKYRGGWDHVEGAKSAWQGEIVSNPVTLTRR